MSKLEYKRSSKAEGWTTIISYALVTPTILLFMIILDAGLLFWILFFLILILSAYPISKYVISHLRNKSSFSCCLTDQELIQIVPISSIGDNFKINLEDICAIEIELTNDCGGDNWYIHANSKRYQICRNYENPHSSFGRLLQKRLPHIKNFKT
ncbi:hypothetical protein OAB00_03665 [Akkermansiaceae bacterium]|nr:hypothetical protein [Akkermansiaceae bacterium]